MEEATINETIKEISKDLKTIVRSLEAMMGKQGIGRLLREVVELRKEVMSIKG